MNCPFQFLSISVLWNFRTDKNSISVRRLQQFRKYGPEVKKNLTIFIQKSYESWKILSAQSDVHCNFEEAEWEVV